MSDLIKRDDAIREVSEPFDEYMWDGVLHPIRYIVDALKAVPSADRPMLDDGTLVVTIADATAVTRVLVEDSKKNGDLYYADRPKGEWIYIDEPIIGNPYGRYRCSKCDLEEPFKSDYCPNCGADMRGEEDES